MIRLCAFSDEAASGLPGQIAALARNNVALTELRSVDGRNVSDLTEKEAREIRARLKDGGISVWAVGSPLGKEDISAVDESYFEGAKRLFSVARALETDKVRAFSFFRAYDARERVLEACRRLAEIARGFGVTLYHENEKEIYGDTAARVRDLMQALPEWRFVYDPANFVQVGERAEDTLPLAPCCAYFHIKDVVSATGEVVPAGEGDGKIADLLFHAEGRTLTLEPHLALFEGYGAIDNTEMKHRFEFASRDEAFDAAAAALKGLLVKAGYREIRGGFVK